MQYGVEILSDSELLAILLGNGSKGQNVLAMANTLLRHFGDLRKVSTQSIPELKKIQGIGTVKALEIKACLEIARRFNQIVIRPGETVRGSQQVFEHYHERLRDVKKENFFCILLDCKHRIIKEELISVGTLNLSIVHPREVFSAAIRESAESIILIHNHPSGDPRPSREDMQVTNRLIEVGELVGIEIIDHIVIGNGSYISFLEQKLL